MAQPNPVPRTRRSADNLPVNQLVNNAAALHSSSQPALPPQPIPRPRQRTTCSASSQGSVDSDPGQCSPRMVDRNNSIAEEEDIYTDNVPDPTPPPVSPNMAWGENLITGGNTSSSSQGNSFGNSLTSTGFVPVTTSNPSGSHMTSHMTSRPKIVPSRVDVVRAQFGELKVNSQQQEMTKLEFEKLSARVAELKVQEQRLLSSISQLGGTEGAGLRQREEKLSQWELDLQRREERLRSETSDREFMLTERERDVQHREDEVHVREKQVKHKEFDLTMDSHDNTGDKLASLASKEMKLEDREREITRREFEVTQREADIARGYYPLASPQERAHAFGPPAAAAHPPVPIKSSYGPPPDPQETGAPSYVVPHEVRAHSPFTSQLHGDPQPHPPPAHTYTQPHGPPAHTYTQPHGPPAHTYTQPHPLPAHTYTQPHGPPAHTYTQPHPPQEWAEPRNPGYQRQTTQPFSQRTVVDAPFNAPPGPAMYTSPPDPPSNPQGTQYYTQSPPPPIPQRQTTMPLAHPDTSQKKKQQTVLMDEEIATAIQSRVHDQDLRQSQVDKDAEYARQVARQLEAEEHLALDIDTQLALILQQEALQANDLTITNELTASGSDMPNSASAQQLIEKRVKEELQLQREREEQDRLLAIQMSETGDLETPPPRNDLNS